MPPLEEDGLGQGWLGELRWFLRFLRSRQVAVPWRRPTSADAERVARHPQLPRFGDETVAAACYNGRWWVALENDWFGFPDPPRYAVFALEGEGVWMACNFNVWPRAWPLPWDAGGPS